MPQLRESFLRKTNLQHAMHNFYWYITEFYFTSDPFSNEQRTKCSGRKIYTVGIENFVWSLCERYIGTFYFFFLLYDSLLSTVGFVPSGRVGSRKYFLWGFECIVYILKQAYIGNSTIRILAAAGIHFDFSIHKLISERLIFRCYFCDIEKLHEM